MFDTYDRIVAANDEQRKIMPCCEYTKKDTYVSLFWSLIENGMNGNPVARKSPEVWLDGALRTRKNSPNLDFVNRYAWGAMLVSHLRLDDGTSIQARLDMRMAGMEKYFDGPEACLGVTRALRFRRQIHALEEALDSLGLAVALVDGAGGLLHANTSFAELLNAGDGLVKWSNGSVCAVDGCDQIVFSQSLAHVSEGLIPTTYVPIRRKGGRPLIVALSTGATLGTVVVAAARFGEDLQEINTVLQKIFGVTATEAEIMVALGTGNTPAEVTRSRGVAMQTTYKQIDNIKRKMRSLDVAAPDLPGISSVIMGIAAITRSTSTRKN